MSMFLMFIGGLVGLGLFLLLFAAHKYLMGKTGIACVVQVQCSTGDSEVMSFNYNFLDGESLDSKQSKIQEAFVFIQDRRDENHKKWLAIKAEAEKENKEKLAKGESILPN